MASLSDSVDWIQLLELMIILWAIIGQIPSAKGYNELWEKSDLIVEEKIMDVKIQEGELLGTAVFNKVIKASEEAAFYSKGLEHGTQILVRSPKIEEGKYNRLYLEEIREKEYRVIKAELVPEPTHSMDYGLWGYTSLVLVAFSVYILTER